MDALELLTHRVSCGQLQAPAPAGETLELMLTAALRAPDHARLRPWEFIVFEGEARERLGELIATAMIEEKPASTPEELARARGLPLRAPMLIAVVAKLREHPKVPAVEQIVSAGCAALNLLLAANAQGFGGIWRTGFPASSPAIKRGLGLQATDEIVGYLYLGTPVNTPAVPVVEQPGQFMRRWPAA